MSNYVCYNEPETLEEVLKDIASITGESDYDTIVNSAYASFFTFYTPKYITATTAADLEKFVLHYFILRRIGCANVKKWRELFRNKWTEIMFYYERLLDTVENEETYIGTNPILTDKITTVASGNSNETNRYLDTPQGNASHVWELNAQGQPQLNDTYLTDVRGITVGSNRNETRTGFGGKSPSELLKEYRDTFLPIYQNIVDDLEECFYQIYDEDLI